MKQVYKILLLSFVLIISACGQSGPLFLPDKTKPKSDTDGSFLLYK
jgi:predicted small lipoprotein YifL